MEWISFRAPARMTTGPSARTIAGLANNPAPRPAPRPAMNSRRRIPDVIEHSSFNPEKCNKHAARTGSYQRLERARDRTLEACRGCHSGVEAPNAPVIQGQCVENGRAE